MTAPSGLRARIPALLQATPAWVGHHSKKPLVLPDGRRAARTNDPKTWRGFGEAAKFHEKLKGKPGSGIGFVFQRDQGIVFIDFDHCLDDAGVLASWAEPLLAPFRGRTFVEHSPSGHGLHILALGSVDHAYPKLVPPGATNNGHIEVYNHHRFATMTGDAYDGAPVALAPMQDEVDALIAALGGGAGRGAGTSSPSHDELAPDRSAAEGEPDTARVKSALEAIDPDLGHEDWVKVGMALHHGYRGSAEGLRLWDEWSSRGRKYVKNEPAECWRSFRRSGVTLGTLFHMAREAGWKPGPTAEQDFKAMADEPGGPIPGVSGCQKGRRWVGDKTARNIELALTSIYSEQLEMDTRAGAVLLNGRRLEEGSERNALAANIADALGWNEDPRVGSLRAGIAGAAGRRAFDPVVRYLDQLPAWDRVQRFEELARALGVEAADAANSADLLRRWCLGAVRRARQPGVQMDNTLVLLGKQGRRKTAALRTLAEVVAESAAPLFARANARIKDKDGRIALQGPWIVELAELATVRSAEKDVVKGFLDEREDWYRPPYGETFIRRPRRVTFAGTTNDKEFLNDDTGARRYWPIAIAVAIDLTWIRANRDKLWAEADARVKDGEPHWFEEDPDWLLARHEEAHEEGAIEEEVERVAEGREKEWRERGWFRLSDVIPFLPDSALRTNHRSDLAVGAKLRRLGFQKSQRTVDGVRKKVWVRPEWPPPTGKEVAGADVDDLL